MTKQAENSNTTPLMKQYHAIKLRYPDTVLLYRMGDFYETFEEDAKIASKVLGITLTSRSNGKAARVPLAGFPYHALENYTHKFTSAGYRVAICEQVEDPKTAKGIVKRDVIEVITPGSSMSEQFLDAKESNYLASLFMEKSKLGLALIDVSTGRFQLMDIHESQLSGLITSLNPKEILIADSQANALKSRLPHSIYISELEDWIFHKDFAELELKKKFATHSLKGFGIEKYPLGISAAGAILHYLQTYQGRKLEHVTSIKVVSLGNKMVLDSDTIRNLELFRTLNYESEGTLLSSLDETHTSMGGRLLREWIAQPLLDQKSINHRLDTVEWMLEHGDIRKDVRDLLKDTSDLERVLAKLSTSRGNARDLNAIKSTLALAQELGEMVLLMPETYAKEWDELPDLSPILSIINENILDEPPVSVKDGKMIRDGIDSELDEIRAIATNAKDWLIKFQHDERARLDISSLKVGFNKVFGYYIEITHRHKDNVPDNYIRKQTLVNCERYITEELKDYEDKVLHAEERYTAREYEIFDSIRIQVLEVAHNIQTWALAIAGLDVVSSLANLAFDRHYVRPEINESSRIEIKNGRHPVIEELLPIDDTFIPNDLIIDADSEQILLITGPNMAGKSTYLRQIGLIVLMAQIGSFVPAEKASIGMVDRIFTRVGASDNLARGESTFLVEMNETANILNNATKRSLILLDEIGRGTSTYDGLAIAWSIIEYLHGQKLQAARTLFATHYHELVGLENVLSRVKNYNVAVREYGDKIIFLRKIIPGGADRSYGIHVAQMAGVPQKVLIRAREILANLDSGQIAVKSDRVNETVSSYDANQLSLFARTENQVEKRLRDIDINKLTPLEALNLIDELVRELENK
jgi:DNA mismatch repair protein MutS